MTAKEYMAKYYADNREKILARAKAYYVANRPKVLVYHKTYDVENHDAHKKYHAAYRVVNQEKIKANRARHYATNLEKAKADAGAYYAVNRAAISAQRKVKHAIKRGDKLRKKLSPSERLQRSRTHARQYQATHRAEANKRLREWKRKHPDAQRADQHKRRVRKKGNGGSWTAAEWNTLKRQYGHRCVGCWKTERELQAVGRKLVPDHIVSLAKRGMNDITNIQPLCHGSGGCNNRKGSKYIDFVIS